MSHVLQVASEISYNLPRPLTGLYLWTWPLGSFSGSLFQPTLGSHFHLTQGHYFAPHWTHSVPRSFQSQVPWQGTLAPLLASGPLWPQVLHSMLEPTPRCRPSLFSWPFHLSQASLCFTGLLSHYRPSLLTGLLRADWPSVHTGLPLLPRPIQLTQAYCDLAPCLSPLKG